MSMSNFKVLLEGRFNGGITEDTSEEEAYDIRMYNETVLKSITFSLVLLIIFSIFKLKFAICYALLVMVYLFYEYFIAGKANITRKSLNTSIFMTTAHSLPTIYYGFSYGFQYLLVISFIASILNLTNHDYRRYYYYYATILLIIGGIIIYLNSSSYIINPYGNAINILMMIITFLVAFQLSEIFVESTSNDRQEKRGKLDLLKLKNDEIKSFNHSIAHDLKEPLRSIGGFSNLLYAHTSEEKKNESAVFNEFIQKGVTRMESLLDDLMVFIETSDRKVLDEEVDLNYAFSLAQENLHQKILDTGAKIEVSDLPKIKSNLNSIILLFQNFMNNSMKFTKENTVPEVKVYSEEHAEGVTVYIKDSGIGISKKDRNKIFIPFSRLNSKDKFEGSGLGLSLCNRIIGYLEGHIDLESELGNGACFKIHFPKAVIMK